MHLKELGDTGVMVSEIGLGTWKYRGGVEPLRRGVALGAFLIDTAEMYRTEDVVGQAISGSRDGVFLASKVLGSHLRYDQVMKAAEASLRRLAVECMDLYQIHWPEPPENVEEGWQTMLDLKEQGKIRWAGVCNFFEDSLARAEPLGHVSSVQSQFSILDRRVEPDILQWCREKNAGFLGYSPMHSGLLTGKVSREWYAGLPDNDWRKHKKGHPVTQYLQESQMDNFLSFVDELRDIAAGSGHTVGQLAVAWVLSNPVVTSAIVGARKPGQITETAQAAQWELSTDELERIHKAHADFLAKVG